MESARTVTPDIDILPSYFAVPGLGMVPVNAYVIKARQPLLLDTGLHQDHDAFLEALRSVIDPKELRWLWLSHPDQDHVGALHTLMAEAPQLKLVTNFLGYGILSLFEQVPLDRVYLVNPGESFDLGDRQLTALRPPSYDNPATMGFFDSKSRALFSSDCFGAVLQSPAETAEDIGEDAVRGGQTLWSTVDAPWLHTTDPAKLARNLNLVRDMDPAMILSSHLPPARGMTTAFLSTLAGVADAEPFVGPNQAALTAMLAAMTQGTAATA